MTNTNSNSVDAPALDVKTPDSAPSPAQHDAFSSLFKFSDVKTSMTTDTAHMHAVPITGLDERPKNVAVTGPASRPGTPEEQPSKLAEKYITPEELAASQERAEGMPIAEGETPGRGIETVEEFIAALQAAIKANPPEESPEPDRRANLDALNASASTKFDDDGNIKAVSSEFGDTKITYEFKDDGQITRTTNGPEGTEVANFSAGGEQLSREKRDESGKVVTQEVDQADRLLLGNSSDGKINSIDSGVGERRVTMSLDGNGKIDSRTMKVGNLEILVDFNSDGTPSGSINTHFGENGNIKQRRVFVEGIELNEKMDENGQRVDWKRVSEDKTETFKKLRDGGEMVSNEDDMAADFEITDKDGNKVLSYVFDESRNLSVTTMKNPDGSDTRTVVTPETSSSLTIRPDGSWERTDINHDRNHPRVKSGSSLDDWGVEQRAI